MAVAAPPCCAPLCSSSVLTRRHRCVYIGFSSRISLTLNPYFLLIRSPSSCKTSFLHRTSTRSFFQEQEQKQTAEFGRELSEAQLQGEANKNDALNWRADGILSSQEEEFVEEQDESEDEPEALEDGYRMARVCDRLIDVFLVEKTKSEDWRKLLAFSKEWPNIREFFFKRCKARAAQDSDPKRKGDLLKLARKLKEVDDDMERHNELLACIKEQIRDLDKLVMQRRKDFTTDFFQHLELLYQANFADPDKQNFLAGVGKQCAEAVEAHDSMVEEGEAMNAAQIKFDDILNSPSLEVARNKIDDLMRRNALDSNLMLLITKAWAASKESNMMKEEVKDILYHLYKVAIGNLQRLVPKEVRIMRHIILLEDPKEQLKALTDAFSPGDELEGNDIDLLYTTPEKLHNWIVIVLDAYYQDKRSTLMKSAQQLMNPALIKRLEILKKMIEDQFL